MKWRVESGDTGRAVTEIGVSDDLMVLACLVPGNAPVQGHRTLSCCGNVLHEEAVQESYQL